MYVNKTYYFDPVPPEVHEYQIGGYQVYDKWLKYHKDRRLNLDDICTYCRIVTAIGITLAIQQEIGMVYADAENNGVLVADQ